MGDKRRFAEFANLVASTIPDRGVAIADVACGKGYLQMWLRKLGFSDIVSFDKRKGKTAGPRRCYQHRWFSYNQHKGEFGLVVAMHPDQGTDHSILYAAKNKVPFLVCPCCILPSASSFWDRSDFQGWVNHLEKLALDTHDVARVELSISGRNLVLVGTPHGHS
jgi:hypothetical protein